MYKLLMHLVSMLLKIDAKSPLTSDALIKMQVTDEYAKRAVNRQLIFKQMLF